MHKENKTYNKQLLSQNKKNTYIGIKHYTR
jgi:hypothetical protein